MDHYLASAAALAGFWAVRVAQRCKVDLPRKERREGRSVTEEFKVLDMILHFQTDMMMREIIREHAKRVYTCH